MKLKLFILILFLSPLLSAAQTYTHPNIEKSVFQIYRGSVTNPSNVGTTFYIGNNRFVTNAHIVYSGRTMNDLLFLYHEFTETNGTTISEQDKQEIIDRLINRESNQHSLEDISASLFIKYENKYISVKKITAISFEDDIAILEIDEKDSKKIREFIPLEIIPLPKNITSKKGSIYGFPANTATSFSEVIFQEMKFKNIFYYNGNFFKTYVNFNNLSGASGSPVLVDGKVVGMMKQSYENNSHSTPSTSLIEILKKPVSLIKNQEIYSLFLSFIEKAKMNPEKNINAIVSLHSLQLNNEDNINSVSDKIDELENLLLLTDDNEDPNKYLVYRLLAVYYFDIGKKKPLEAKEALETKKKQ